MSEDFEILRAENERMREALREADTGLAFAFKRIHVLPRSQDTELANDIAKVRAKISPFVAISLQPAPPSDDYRRGLERDAERYRWLRSRDVDTIYAGGVFIGKTPDNVVLSFEDADAAIDAAIRALGDKR